MSRRIERSISMSSELRNARRFMRPVSGSMVARRCASSTSVAIRIGPPSSRAMIETIWFSWSPSAWRPPNAICPMRTSAKVTGSTMGSRPAPSS